MRQLINSLRCKLGFHDYKYVGWKEESRAGGAVKFFWTHECTRCPATHWNHHSYQNRSVQ